MEIAEVGVKTRARAALAMGATSSAARTPKRTKINNSNSNEEQKFSTASSAFVQLKSRSRSAAVVKLETATVLPELETEQSCSSPSSVEFPASCCSSNGSIGLDEERIKLIDLEVESAQVETSTCNCGEEFERREMSHSSELPENLQELESMETNYRHPLSTAQNMPTELELEEFFATAEKDIQKQFQDKYNYDIVKDVPLEGRYEWIQLKP
ncbi:cyclin-dependent kinase inhibitor 7-like [Gastrolobium bilobum]|uniref:cyclin-dependent kinase inhibitor 7-like n=1 Tax=Gastrolobium bilobum TaxID=150636 RepID=UPI002AB20974|nr:cyclin-dependent kinase inhibitor 7-like [Gastrolobium bilobum]